MKMYKIILLAITCLVLFTKADCKKKHSCNSEVSIINRSDQNVIIAFRFTNSDNKCILSGSVLKPGESYEDKTLSCWESRLANGLTFDFYVVDPAKYNTPSIFYSCDSLELRNTILKHYELTLEDIQNNNWTISYP